MIFSFRSGGTARARAGKRTWHTNADGKNNIIKNQQDNNGENDIIIDLHGDDDEDNINKMMTMKLILLTTGRWR